MNPEPGQFLVTIRIERPDGQFVTSSRLVPGDLLTAEPEPCHEQARVAGEITDEFIDVYRRAAELPG